MIRKLLRICSIVLFLSFAYKRLESSKIQYNEIYKVIQQFQNENNNTSSKIDVLEKLFKKFKESEISSEIIDLDKMEQNAFETHEFKEYEVI